MILLARFISVITVTMMMYVVNAQNESSSNVSTMVPTVMDASEQKTNVSRFDNLPDNVRAKLRFVPDKDRIPGDYIIIFNQTRVIEVKETVKQILIDNSINLTKAYEAVKAAKVKVFETFGNGTTIDEKYVSLLIRLVNSSLVLYVEEDSIQRLEQTDNTTKSTIMGTYDSDNFTISQSFPTWGLDRIDQSTLPLNNVFHSDFSGEGVTAYVVDTGINPTHEEFEGRATCEFTAFTDESCIDLNGHGTHVAGTYLSSLIVIFSNNYLLYCVVFY